MTAASTYHLIPPEILLDIYSFYYESSLPGFHIQTDEDNHWTIPALVAPLHIDRRTREALWRSQRIWRSIGSCLSVGSLGEKTFDSTLRICSRRTAQTLNSLNLRCLVLSSPVCLERLLRRLQVFEASSKSLRRIFAGNYLSQEPCRCSDCYIGQLQREPLNYIFRLIGKAPNLETLAMFLGEWPDSYILSDVAEKSLARPTRLTLCVANDLEPSEQGRLFYKDLASRVEHLILWSYSAIDEEPPSFHDGGSDDEPDEIEHEAPVLYKIVLQSAAKTLRHLEIRVRDEDRFPREAFVTSSFNSLETLFVHMPEFLNIGPALASRCQMPSLTTIVVPASILPLIQATSVTRAGLAFEDGQQVMTVRKALREWPSLKILSFHVNVAGVDINEMLMYLTPQIDHQPFLCPDLEALAIYAMQPNWWLERLEIEDMPRRFDWRGVSELRTWAHTPEFQAPSRGELPRIENILARMIITRQKLCDQPEPAKYTIMKALREVRVIGYEIDAPTWKSLIKMSEIPRFAIWPHPPDTKAVMLWNKVTPEGREGTLDDLDEPSESIYYVPSW